ncbi:helix-turn-helix transcriptional regulator [Streptomyces sp. RO-S4]|uniref:helix-turn-helix domain-containing protein n=1 Tax=unclassified Streptomyces TaxID=2593676 RepID=UPI00208E66E5|nr:MULTISPECIES: helix-turn-helix transcriptional regulator [unclassified Streptomyces]MCO4695728.1 helix-turn-helix transcriptional regulator [Streptomyces sp. RO-S4]MDU0305217.1 helix-turn-helix transcriptional regulator [Streptomyces sp. PAL114]
MERMSEENRLGDYLRARRELVTPADMGLPVHGIRRVPGLRREEVALLAGISSDYYLRLEQGRDRNPSAQVLDALARVLLLDDTATAYLHQLAAPRPRARRRPSRRPAVPPATAQLLQSVGLPAFVTDRTLDVIAVNPLASALVPSVRVGENRLRSFFLDPAERDLHADWSHTAAQCVAVFRRRLGSDVDDPRVVRLVGELSLASAEFRKVWARHDVRPVVDKPIRMNHPQVGELSLTLSKLDVDGPDGLMLAAYHAAPGSEDAERLALLASLTTEPARRATGLARRGVSGGADRLPGRADSRPGRADSRPGHAENRLDGPRPTT